MIRLKEPQLLGPARRRGAEGDATGLEGLDGAVLGDLIAHNGLPPGDDAGHRELSGPTVVGHHTAQLPLTSAGVEGGGAGPVSTACQPGAAIGQVIRVLSQCPGQLTTLVPGRRLLRTTDSVGTTGRLTQAGTRLSPFSQA